MITVRSSREGIDIKGHSGYAATGSDIVCSAISVLTYTLLKTMDWNTADKISYKLEKGGAKIRYDYDKLSKNGRLLVDAFFVGVYGVSSEYPDYVQLVYE